MVPLSEKEGGNHSQLVKRIKRYGLKGGKLIVRNR